MLILYYWKKLVNGKSIPHSISTWRLTSKSELISEDALMLNDNSKNLSYDLTNIQWIAFYTFGVQTWTQSDCKCWHTLFLVKNISDAETHFFGQRLETDYKPTTLKKNIKAQFF